MHRGTSDDREGRWLARDHAGSPRYENPGAKRAYQKRRCARAARRVLRLTVDDVSMTDIELELDAEAAREQRLVEIRKMCDESIAWDDHEWDCEWPYVYGRDYSADYDEELRASREDARERALDAALYLQGEDPEGDDQEVATSREVERERRARRFHQKYHRD